MLNYTWECAQQCLGCWEIKWQDKKKRRELEPIN